jgi:hypothetical protein
MFELHIPSPRCPAHPWDPPEGTLSAARQEWQDCLREASEHGVQSRLSAFAMKDRRADTQECLRSAVVDTWAGFDDLEPEWNPVLARSRANSVLLSWE